MLFTDLNEVKALLDIDPQDKVEDKKLNFYIDAVTDVLRTILNRDFDYKQRTEYYGGTGTQKLVLRVPPVYPTTGPTGATTGITVYQDSAGFYGEPSGAFTSSDAELTLGSDFAIPIDSSGVSRSGILVRLHGLWLRPQVRVNGLLSPFIGEAFGNYKVTYYGGYTVDTLPSGIRLAVNLLITKFRYIFPLGLALSSESYEDRSISLTGSQKSYLFDLARPLLLNYRNWRF